jgi:hypothetical protein
MNKRASLDDGLSVISGVDSVATPLTIVSKGRTHSRALVRRQDSLRQGRKENRERKVEASKSAMVSPKQMDLELQVICSRCGESLSDEE